MLSDFRLALRTLAKSPGFVVVAVFTLAVGVAVSTTMFSIVNAVALRGLPFPDQHRLLHVENHNLREGINSMGVSARDFADYRAAQKSFEDLAAYQEGTYNLSGPGGDPDRVTGCTITWSGPAMLRVPAHLGRWFNAADGEPNAAPVVVLGYSVWQNRFKGDPAVVGTQVKVNSVWATVVGIAPEDFRFPEEADAWMPWRKMRDEENRDNRYLEVFGRLKDGATPGQARAELQTVGANLAAAHAATNKDVGVTVKPLRDEFVGDDTMAILGVMLGSVMLVMLIACANVANLLLARAGVRTKEIAIRTALGSGRGRIVRLLLTEALLLAGAGAAIGLAASVPLMAVFRHHILSTNPPPYWMVFTIDHVSVLFTAGLALLAAFLAGFFPAWRASRSDFNAVLKDGTRGSTGAALSKFTRFMVIAEVVLSTILLVLSGLSVRSVIKMQTTDLGYETAGLFTNRVGLPEAEYKTIEAQRDFYARLLERLAARPEIAAAALTNTQPTWNNRATILLEGETVDKNAPRRFATEIGVSGSYFETLGIRLLQGRAFDRRDTGASEPVAIVSSRFVERYWPGQNPLGKRFAYTPGGNEPPKWLTVVGVVRPTLQGDFHGRAETPQAYVPYTQRNEARFFTLITKARHGDAAGLSAVVRATVRELNDDLPIYWAKTLEQMVADAKFFKKLFAWIYGIFGGVALLLAGIGLYGVMAYSVGQRTQEIGVRMALGATAGDVLRLILREGGLRLALGLAVGLFLAFFAAKLQANSLFGITPSDPVTYVTTLFTLGTAGLLACLVPALRALRVNPVEALRNE